MFALGQGESFLLSFLVICAKTSPLSQEQAEVVAALSSAPWLWIKASSTASPPTHSAPVMPGTGSSKETATALGSMYFGGRKGNPQIKGPQRLQEGRKVK